MEGLKLGVYVEVCLGLGNPFVDTGWWVALAT